VRDPKETRGWGTITEQPKAKSGECRFGFGFSANFVVPMGAIRPPVSFWFWKCLKATFRNPLGRVVGSAVPRYFQRATMGTICQKTRYRAGTRRVWGSRG